MWHTATTTLCLIGLTGLLVQLAFWTRHFMRLWRLLQAQQDADLRAEALQDALFTTGWQGAGQVPALAMAQPDQPVRGPVLIVGGAMPSLALTAAVRTVDDNAPAPRRPRPTRDTPRPRLRRVPMAA
ncbi:hypothetical protein GTZ99_06275 [Novosphingobium sp. FSY-8]|uniref:Uncharacterized protein n=1 Tax=Novosphingobium ovatum TaxID=1908523 RepID=A0ABW9XC99_9SPHN|nr:hypothetical protein [Novosphingobium ovatum]NBC36162.1 hypothetical protein [Novosphingobium ovatum]